MHYLKHLMDLKYILDDFIVTAIYNDIEGFINEGMTDYY